MTLVFNLSLGGAWGLEVVAMVALMVGLLLLNDRAGVTKTITCTMTSFQALCQLLFDVAIITTPWKRVWK